MSSTIDVTVFQQADSDTLIRVKTWGSMVYEIPSNILLRAGYDLSNINPESKMMVLSMLPSTFEKSIELIDYIRSSEEEITLDPTPEVVLKMYKKLRKSKMYKWRWSKESKMRKELSDEFMTNLRKFFQENELGKFAVKYTEILEMFVSNSKREFNNILFNFNDEMKDKFLGFCVSNISDFIEALIKVGFN